MPRTNTFQTWEKGPQRALLEVRSRREYLAAVDDQDLQHVDLGLPKSLSVKMTGAIIRIPAYHQPLRAFPKGCQRHGCFTQAAIINQSARVKRLTLTTLT